MAARDGHVLIHGPSGTGKELVAAAIHRLSRNGRPWVARALVVPAATTVRLSDLGVARASWPTLAMVDRAADQDGCKGAAVRLSFTATGKRK